MTIANARFKKCGGKTQTIDSGCRAVYLEASGDRLPREETSNYLEEAFRGLGYDLVMAEGITGFYTVIDTGKPGPEVLVLGELDAVICPSHEDADPRTGAVHSCGHHAQCAALLGLAAALTEPGIKEKLCGKIAALSVDTNVEIVDLPGYAPLVNDPNMMDMCQEAAGLMVPEYGFRKDNFIGSGSTDMGDLSCIMPVVHPYAAGAQGKSHGNDYRIIDPEKACVGSAKWQLAMLYLLLKDDAVRAKQIMAAHKPMFESKEAYLAYVDSLNDSGNRITYHDGMAEVQL